MATLITLKLRKKNVLFTKAITSLIWVFLKFLVQRTETLLVLFRLPYIGPRSRTLAERYKPVPNLWGVLPPPRYPECGRMWNECGMW